MKFVKFLTFAIVGCLAQDDAFTVLGFGGAGCPANTESEQFLGTSGGLSCQGVGFTGSWSFTNSPGFDCTMFTFNNGDANCEGAETVVESGSCIAGDINAFTVSCA
jgi:hypothetical protein